MLIPRAPPFSHRLMRVCVHRCSFSPSRYTSSAHSRIPARRSPSLSFSHTRGDVVYSACAPLHWEKSTTRARNRHSSISLLYRYTLYPCILQQQQLVRISILQIWYVNECTRSARVSGNTKVTRRRYRGDEFIMPRCCRNAPLCVERKREMIKRAA